MSNRISIAVDGPAGSGKSTISKIIANKLNILHLDTGAMYRAVALTALEKGISISDVKAVEGLLKGLDMVVTYEDGVQRIFVNGIDVMGRIRTAEVSKAASDIAVIPAVRIKLVEIQRALSEKYSLIIDGRDIGSYVLPNADYKFYITATPEVRARRRLKEQQSKGLETNKSLDEMVKEIIARDKTDSTREFAPLVRTEDAHYIDTTDMSIEQVVSAVLDIIQKGKQ